MRHETTLRALASIQPSRIRLAETAIILIDFQNEYIDGRLPLDYANVAVRNAETILSHGRRAGARIIHVAHQGRRGSAVFDPDGHGSLFIDGLSPAEGETVIHKSLPNAFTDTRLGGDIANDGRRSLLIIGFMSHMCVSSTVRSAAETGYDVTVISDACATRALPDASGGTIDADTVHRAAMAAMGDRFAEIIPSTRQWLDVQAVTRTEHV